MQTDFINIGLGFLEGLLLIISPCILPILPIILSGSVIGSKKRSIGIIAGFISSLSIFIFFSRLIVQHTGLDLNLIRHISYFLLFIFGVILFSNYLTEKFSQISQSFSNLFSHHHSSDKSQTGFLSGILFGGLIAIVWTPCVGPILAAVIVQTIIQKTTLLGFLTVLAFAIGVAIPMFILALFGRKVMTKFSFFKNNAVFIRKTLGIIIILSVAYMIYSENVATLPAIAQTQTKTQVSLEEGLSSPYPAPAIAGINAWINSKPLQINDLKGKVVLIDFWTYSCINCIRTLPYLNDWYNKYHNQGLVIIGVHSPEFDFEKDLNNVHNAVMRYNIHYPVALDNNFVTWQNYANRAWPAHYLIDKNGNVVYQSFGEGEYDTTENNIRFLLGMTAVAPSTLTNQNNNYAVQTPETYLGYARANSFASPETVSANKSVAYTFPQELSPNYWALQGHWVISASNILSTEANSILKINFNAPKVFIVMGSSTQQPIRVKILLDNKPVTNEQGKDVMNSIITVRDYKLYDVIKNHSGMGVLQIIPLEPGLEVYTFTFGE